LTIGAFDDQLEDFCWDSAIFPLCKNIM
jgi:hypothetical protein